MRSTIQGSTASAHRTWVSVNSSRGLHSSIPLFAVILVLLLLVPNDSLSQTVTRNLAGTSSTTFQLGSTSAKKTQQLYAPADLTGATAGDILTVYFMYNSTAAQSFADLVVSMGQTAGTALTTTFATGLTQVFSGSITIPAGTAGDWFAIPLNIPFSGYNPAQSLIIETKWETNPTSTSWAVRTGASDPSGTNRKVYASTTGATTGTLTTTRANFGFDVVPSVPMVYDSSRVVQASTLPVLAGSVDQVIIGIPVYVHGTQTPLSLTQLNLNTTGTTDVANLTNARVYYTGSSPAFATGNQFGVTVADPSGAYVVTGSQQLSYGVNNFWVAYDISGSATEYNVVDGECTSITVSAVPHTPATTAPAGNRIIRYPLVGNKTIAPAGTYTSFTSAIDELNLLGVGTGGVTFSVADGATFNESPLRITASGTSGNPIIFQRSGVLEGSEPVLSITGTSAATDAAIRLVGSDYITFDGIDVRNAGSSATDWVEFGFHLIDSLGTNGCQYNTIKNCIVTLDTANNATKGIYTFTNASGPDGLNSFNSFLNNTVQSTHSGYYLDGQGTSNLDEGNVIGTEGAGSSTVTNYGGGTAVIYGIYAIYQTDLLVYNTTVSDAQANGTSVTYGIYASNSVATVDSNVVTDLKGNGAVYGIYMASGATHEIRKNRVHNLFSTSTGTPVMYGIYAGSTVTGSIYNNMVYDLRSAQSTNTIGVVGIYPAGGAGATMHVFHNTVYLDYVSAAAGNTSSALYVATALLVDIRNNIFVNMSDMTGGLRGAAFRKSTASYANLSSNNNLFYAGTPSAKNLIFYDGTNSDSTLVDYKVRVAPNDQASISHNPPFINATSPYDVHISTVDSTAVESGGQVITLPFEVSDDIDGNKRYGFPGYAGTGSAPDIGADEFDGVGPDLVGPSITYAVLTAAPVLPSVTFAGVSITDPSGVNTTAGTRPRLYFKKSSDANTYAGNTSGDNGWKYVEATGSGPFAFATNHSLLFGGGPVVLGDIIQYFVVAQDLASPVNVGVNTGTFATAPTSVNLSAGNFPLTGTINSYVIRPSISGSYAIGGLESIATVKAFFDSVNGGVLTGNVTASIVGNTIETATASLDQVPEYPALSGFTITIQPSGNRSVSGDIAGAVIKLNGADRVTIDGINSGGNNLSISNIGTASSSAAIWVSSLGTALGATDVTIKNCNISAGSNNVTSTFGIIASGTTISTTGTGANNDNLTIQNNTVTNAYYGIFTRGTTTGRLDNLLITGNAIGHADTAQTVRFRGIDVASAEAALISQNTIFNMEITTAVDIAGISLGTTCLNSEIGRNRISGIRNRNTTGNGAWGIAVTSTASNTGLMIVNNVIYDITADGALTSTENNPFGIRMAGGAGAKIYFNSVNMYGPILNTTTSDLSAALVVTVASVTGLDIRNNVFANSITGGGTTRSFAIYGISGVTYGTINHNDYYVSGPNAVLGFNGSNVTTLSAWQGFTGQDAASIAANPLFNAPDNLAPVAGSPLLLAGTSIAGVTEDFAGNTRGATPTIGAYELSGDFQGPAITYTLLGNTTGTTTRTMSGVTVTDPAGVNTTAGTRPRVYYKRSIDANAYIDNTSGSNGWKYAEANGVGGSPFDFTITYSRIFGGSVTSGDLIEYFVVAQDLNVTPNVGINSGTFTSPPASVALTGAAFPITGLINSYYVSSALSGVITVGTAQTYASLTGATGVFHGINTNTLAGNLVVEVVSDLTEDGTVALGPWSEEGAGNYTVTIRSSAATERLILGGTAGAMIRLDGADRVTIDGRVGGEGQYLRFRNLSTTGPTFLFINDATNNTIRNCFIEGSVTTTTSGVILFGTGLTTGNDNNTLTVNSIRNRSDSAGVPANLVYSAGTVAEGLRPSVKLDTPQIEVHSTAPADVPDEAPDGLPEDEPASGSFQTVSNSDNSIIDNEFSNFSAKGVSIPNTGNGDNWVISGNSFFDAQLPPPTTAQTSISVLARSTGHVISGNYIGGSKPRAGGTPWVNSGTSAFIGIEAAVDSTTPSLIENNVIQHIHRTSTSSASFAGISLTAGRAVINGNTIGDDATPNSIQNDGSSTTHGISVTAASATQPTTVSNNLIANLSATGAGTAVRVRGINFTGGSRFSMVDNTIHSLSTNSTGSGIAAGSPVAVGIHLWPGGVFYIGEVSRNTIHGISANNTGAIASVATGMMLTNLQGPASRNLVYDIRNLSTATNPAEPPIASGVYLRFLDEAIFANNMVAVGYNQSTNTQLHGVWNAAGDTGNDILFVYNSVSVAGTASAGDLSGAAFLRTDLSATTLTMRNNIFSNTRSGGTGKHYAIANLNTPGWSGATSNYNVLHGNAAAIGLWLSVDQTFAGWQATSGGDANSVSGNPLFTSATDLHISDAASPASNAGIPVVGVTDDFDGSPRSATTPDIGADEFTAGSVNVGVSIATGWNMISNPVSTSSDSVRQLYPNASFNYAFAFESGTGYVQRFTLDNGIGYWEKFPGSETNMITGLALTLDTVQVQAGWNMVGSLSIDLDTSNIIDPGGIRLTDWYGYSAGYFPAVQIVAGKAYWVKVAAPGVFIFNGGAVPTRVAPGQASLLDGLNTLVITDTRGGSQTLYVGKRPDPEANATQYALPPIPPAGAFDARFETADGGSMVSMHDADAASGVYAVAVQSEAYPLTVRWNISDGAYELVDGMGGAVFGNRMLVGEGEIQITNSAVKRFEVRLTGNDQVPKEYALQQNYPNPFNPVTTIQFALPVDSRVTMEAYNALGQRVRTLLNESRQAGYYSVEWNGTGNGGQMLGSGVYFIRLEATGIDGRTFTQMLKTVLMK